jgi:Tol biopolymer transport system component
VVVVAVGSITYYWFGGRDADDGIVPFTFKIAFVSERDGDGEIYVMDDDGSSQTNLTNNPAYDAYPAWSPDGSKIAFTSNRVGGAEIYVMDDDGSNQTNLTNNPAYDAYPTWSPDGNQIAFVSGRDGNAEIYVMDADGSNQTNLTNNPANDTYPAWSPDPDISKIAFTSNRVFGQAEIYVMDDDGSNQTNLTNSIESYDAYPAWSHDGSKIAFTSYRYSDAEIYVMDDDGSNQTNLTNNPAYDAYPAWSPDPEVSKIAFVSDRHGGPLGTIGAYREIYVMDADGSNPTSLTNYPANDNYPACSPLLVDS